MPLLRPLIANSITGYLGSSEKWHKSKKKKLALRLTGLRDHLDVKGRCYLNMDIEFLAYIFGEFKVNLYFVKNYFI